MTPCGVMVPFDELAKLRELACVGIVVEDEPVAEPFAERAVAVENVCLAARHSGAEVEADVSEDDDGAGRHVLAGVITDAFDHGDRAGVANREALTRRARAEELSPRRAVERRVADEARIAGIVGRRGDHDATAAHRLADVVVRLADEVELDSRGEECAEALTGEALEAGAHAARRRRRPCDSRDRAAEPGPAPPDRRS